MNLQLTSRLHSRFLSDLEIMFYFHPEQGHYTKKILEQVCISGSPQIAQKDDLLKFHLPLLPESQTLYAVDHQGSEEILKGVVIYIRSDYKTIEILHIAIAPNLTHTSNKGKSPVYYFILKEMFHIGSVLKGIECIQLPYGRGILMINNNISTNLMMRSENE